MLWKTIGGNPYSGLRLLLLVLVFYLGVHEKNQSELRGDNSLVFRRFLPSKEIVFLSLAFMFLQMIRKPIIPQR